MKPVLEVIDTSSNRASLQMFRVLLQSKQAHWHYHPECELTYVIEGSGIRMVGDHTGQFRKGDLMLTGENLPHDFNVLKPADTAEFLVVQFSADIFSVFSELNSFHKLVEQSRQGILIQCENGDWVDRLQSLEDLTPSQRLIGFLGLMDELSQNGDQEILSSEIMNSLGDLHLSRMNTVMNHIQKHYTRSIDISEMAELTCMTEQSFCRWFKRLTTNSFINYLNNYRTEQACRQLITTDAPISRIALDSGFATLSSFNRVFKKNNALSPMEYRNQWKS